jgi:hypothetical protein
MKLSLPALTDIFPGARLGPNANGSPNQLCIVPLPDGAASISTDGTITARTSSQPAGLSFRVADAAQIHPRFAGWPCSPDLANAIEALGGRVDRRRFLDPVQSDLDRMDAELDAMDHDFAP